MFDPDRPGWQNPRVLAILLVVFLSGGVCGALTMRQALKISYSGGYWKTSSMPYVYRLTKELKLSPEQQKQLQMILDDYARYHMDLQAQMDDWKATGRNQILKILNPDQRARFEELMR